MRKPTPPSELYAWHKKMLAGLNPQITHEPECGWFKRRLVKLGPWLPARIWMEQITDADGFLIQDEKMRCEVAGVEKDPVDQWTFLAGQPIAEREYVYLRALKSWADVHARHHPIANPGEAVDFLTAPIPF